MGFGEFQYATGLTDPTAMAFAPDPCPLSGTPVHRVQDADLEYNPENYPLLLEPLLSGKADVVFGSRFVGGKPHRVLFFWHMIGNEFLTLLSNMFTNLNLTDMETGYKAFRAALIKSIQIEEDRFGVEPEMIAKLARKDCRIYEVGISYSGRTYAEGKKINWKDGVYAFYAIIKYNLRQRRP
jgi:hypothetical protein